MKAAIFKGPGAVEARERPDPVIQQSTDAIVRVVLGCVCGSDLWYFRGESPHAAGSIGHEFIGVVEQAGAEVRSVRPGDLVVAPFIYSDMTCPHCRNGSTISCPAGGNFGNGTIDGGQGEAVRVPQAGGTLVPVPGSGHPDEVLRSLLALSDVMSTGHHAAAVAGGKAGRHGCGRRGRRRRLGGGSAPSASSRSAATPAGRRWPVSSAPPTSSRRAATKQSRRYSS